MIGASLVLGQALLSFAAGGDRRPDPVSPLAAGVGLALMLVLGGVAARLPGEAVTAALALGIAIAAAAGYLRGRVDVSGSGAGPAAALIVLTVVVASIPFVLAGNVGVLGVGLVNDDMASHLLIADYVRDPSGPEPSFVSGGYPIGPHAVVAALAEALGTGLVESFAGFTLALAPLMGLVALAVLGSLPPGRRVLAGALVALPYLGAAYLAQGAFKEPLEAVILITFAVGLAALLGIAPARTLPTPGAEVHPVRRILPLAVLAAASVFNYSLPGLLWIAAVGVLILLARFGPELVASRRAGAGPREALAAALPADALRRARPYLLGAVAVVIVATAQEWGRIADFTRIEAFNPDRFGSDLGNLKQSLSPLEALGIWPSGEYRASPAAASLPAPLFYLGGALAAGALGLGLRRALAAGRPALPAALAATALIWALSSIVSTPYIAAKALAIASPLVMLIALPALLAPGRGRAVRALALAFVGLAAASSLLVVRQAPVGPEAHARELDRIRPHVAGADVLFLGRDDFIAWELRGAEQITGIVTNFYNVEELKGRFRKGEGGGEKFDFDAVFPSDLNQFDYVLTTTGGPQSKEPPRFREVERTRSYVLYERRGRAGKRRTLNEGIEPGAVLDFCDTPRGTEISTGKGTAAIWLTPPVIADQESWQPAAEATHRRAASQALRLSTGRWLISLAYDSRRPLRVRAPELGLEAEVPANLDFAREATPFFPVAEVRVPEAGVYRFEVEVTEPNLLARLVRAPNEAHLRRLSATPLGAVTRIPKRETCGRYVDWYRPREPERSRPPASE